MYYIGTDSYGRRTPFLYGRHGFFGGRTRTGKTTLLEHIMTGAIDSGFCLFDMEGAVSARMLGLIPRRRTNDVIVIDPTADRVPGINFMEGADRALTEQAVRSFFRDRWPDAWGPRSEWLLGSFTYALFAAGDSTLISLSKLLTDQAYRKELAQGADVYLKQFFTHLSSLAPAFRQEMMTALINKVDALARNPYTRSILGQATSSFSFAEAMDRRQIVIVTLPTGKLGWETTKTLGSALFTRLTLDSLARKNTNPYLVVLDEVQTYTAGIKLPEMLATSAKYGLGILSATTNLDLLSKEDQAGILANCDTLASFRTSAQDAKILAPEIGTLMQPRSIHELPNYHCLYRTVEDGRPTMPVIVRVDHPLPFRESRIKEASLRRWGRPVWKVERRIRRHLRA